MTGPVRVPSAVSSEHSQDRLQALKPVRDAVRKTTVAAESPERPQVRAVVAASSRFQRMLAREWHQLDLAPDSDPASIVDEDIDLVVIEVRGGRVPGWVAVEDGPLALAVAARSHDVPVVVWVTSGSQDPEAAAPLMPHASVVFLADAGAVRQWLQRWPEADVAHLAPATAPRLHSPVHGGYGAGRVGDATLMADEPTVGKVTLGGLDELVIPATRMSAMPVLHYWRPKKTQDVDQHGKPLPAPIRHAVAEGTLVDGAEPAVDHYRVLVDAARSATDSSWALLDAAGAQTAVVSLPEYHATLPDDLRPHVATGEHSIAFGREIVARLNQPEVRDREALQLHRAVLAAHTASHRVQAMLGRLGHAAAPIDTSVSIVVPTNRAHQIDNVLVNVARQAHADIELILVLHGIDVSEPDLKARASEQGISQLQVVSAEDSLPLGSVMNLGVEAAGGRYLAKMDDDNFYGRHYLTDLVNAFVSTEAGVVGKWSHYVWLRSTGAVVLRYAEYQNRYHRLVQGGSIVVETALAQEFRFSDIPRAVDTDFLNRLWAAGVRTYSADRFNFASIRNADQLTHTWQVSDVEMMIGGADVVFYGDPRAHVDV